MRTDDRSPASPLSLRRGCLLALCAALLATASPAWADDGGATDGGRDGGAADGGSDGSTDGSAAAGIRLQGGGISCAATGPGGAQELPGAVALAGLLLAGLLLRGAGRRRGAPARTRLVLLCGAALCLSAAPARADFAIDAMHFRPTSMPGGVLNVEGSQVQPHLTGNYGVLISYANQPLISVSGLSGVQSSVPSGVQAQVLMNVGLSIGLFDVIAIGLDVPVMLLQDLGDRAAQQALHGGDPLHTPVAGGVGDLRLSAKLQLRDNHEKLGVALMPLVTVPSGDAYSYLGWGSASVETRLILDYRFGNGLLLAGNVSFFSHEETRAINLRLAQEFRYGIGVYWPMSPRVAVLGEIFGRIGLIGEDDSIAVTAENSPAEALVGLRYRHDSGVTLQIGAGLGLDRGYGAPASRVYGGIGWTPLMRDKGAHPAEAAVQAVPMPKEKEALAAAVSRDRDRDGVEDDLDRCPDQPGPAENLGCPDRDEDGDGVIDRLDQCPTVAGSRENMGCPLDRAAPAVGPAPQAPAPPAQIAVAPAPAALPGAPMGLTRLRGWRFELEEPIAFVPGRAEIIDRSAGVLQAVARVLGERTDVHHVLIEGHVDDASLGAPRARALSRERAEEVLRKLVQLGVVRGRLQAQGFGNTRRLDEGDSPDARERNTRIEIVVVD